MRAMKHGVGGFALVVTLGAAAACDRPVTAPAAEDAGLFAAAKVAGAATVTGTIGPGAPYVMYVPENWNGELVLSIHGYCGFLPAPDGTASCLPSEAEAGKYLAAGYAFAGSGFSELGMAIKDGAIRTAQLKALFGARFGRPERTWLVSTSLGGAIAMRLAESKGPQFDGVLAMCGIVGGVTHQVDFYANVRTLFDYYFPGVLPAEPVPTVPDFFGVVAPAVNGAMAGKLARAMELAAVDQVELQYGNAAQLANAVRSPLMFITSDRFFGDLLRRTHGHEFFDNSQTSYSGSADDAALNAGIERFYGAADARNMLKQWYEPTGELRIPVLTLHNAGDPIVPIHHETRYGELAAAAGASDLLLQRTVPGYAHCTFDTGAPVAALQDLATWVKTGVKPAS